jgi:L-iditol 2-dehydrogenase
VDGAFAPRVVVPASNLHRIPPGIDVQVAALTEPLACVCQCLLDPSVVSPGDRTLVCGPGPMGLLAAQVARALGGDVVVSGLARDRARFAVARALDFEVIEAEHSSALEVDVAIETSGSAAGMRTCMASARRGGRLVQIGIFGRPVETDLDQLLLKELAVSTGFASTPRAWKRATALLSRGQVQLDPLVSDIAPLTEWEGVFDDLRAGRGVKVILDPRS